MKLVKLSKALKQEVQEASMVTFRFNTMGWVLHGHGGNELQLLVRGSHCEQHWDCHGHMTETYPCFGVTRMWVAYRISLAKENDQGADKNFQICCGFVDFGAYDSSWEMLGWMAFASYKNNTTAIWNYSKLQSKVQSKESFYLEKLIELPISKITKILVLKIWVTLNPQECYQVYEGPSYWEEKTYKLGWIHLFV